MAKRKPPVAPQPPVTEDHLEALRMVLASCQNTEALCEKCRNCKVDVQQEAMANAEQAEIAQGLIREFFPNAT